METIEARLRAAGIEPDYTPVEDVADEAVAAIRADQFWILPASERTDDDDPGPDRLDARTIGTDLHGALSQR